MRRIAAKTTWLIYCLTIVLMSGLTASAAPAKCYVLVENPGNFDPDMVLSSSVSLISRYIEPVEAPPPGGIKLDECSYAVHLTESPEGYFIALSGRNLNSIGNSAKTGMDGYTQALLRAIYRTFDDDNMKRKVCDDYADLLASDCKPVEAVVFLFNDRVEMMPQGSIVRKDDRFNIMIQPVNELYAYIVALDSSGKLFKVFPNREVTLQQNPLNAGKQYYFPPLQSKVIFAFDNVPGEEKIYFLLSATPVEEIEAFFLNLKDVETDNEPGKVVSSFERKFTTRGFKLKKKHKQITLDQTDKISHLAQQQVMAELLKGSGILVKTVTFKHVI